MIEIRRTVIRVVDPQSLEAFLCGREEASSTGANVFGNEDFVPLARANDKILAVEAEVTHSFSDTADDDSSDWSDVYMFRLWFWKNGPEGAVASILMPWRDFNGDEPPGQEYGWDRLLNEAVARIRAVRFERQAFTPVIVGIPANEQCMTKNLTTISEASWQ